MVVTWANDPIFFTFAETSLMVIDKRAPDSISKCVGECTTASLLEFATSLLSILS